MKIENLDLNKIYEAKREAHKNIADCVEQQLKEFYKNTGLSLSSIYVDLVEVSIIGSSVEQKYVLSSVSSEIHNIFSDL